MAWSAIFVPFNETPQGQVSLRSRCLEVMGIKKHEENTRGAKESRVPLVRPVLS